MTSVRGPFGLARPFTQHDIVGRIFERRGIKTGPPKDRQMKFMRTPIASILAATCLCAFAGMTSRATATEVTVDGASISLPAPAGFCDMTRNNASDTRALDTIGQLVARANGNRLLAMSADCGQLSEWRAGKRLLGDYGQYQTSGSPAATDALFKETCATLRTEGEQTFSSVKDDVASKMEEAIKNVKVNDQSFAGFLGEDATGCYVAMLQNLQAGNGTKIVQLTLLAITVVKGKFLFVNLYSPYVNSDTVNATLAKLKSTVAAVVAANPN
jgi:hypothetical protein